MVEPRDREPPCHAPLDTQAGYFAGPKEVATGVAAQVTGPLVAAAVELRIRRDGDRDHAAGAHHARNLLQRRLVVLDVLEHLAEDRSVELRFAEWQGGDVGVDRLAGDTIAKHRHRVRRRVDARHFIAERLEPHRQRALAGAGVEDRPARPAGEKQVDKQPLAELVTRPHKLGRGSPLVDGHRSPSRSRRHSSPSTRWLARAPYVSRPPAPRRAASSESSARRLTAPASASGSPGGTSSASRPPVSSSRAAGVSAVMRGTPQARAWNALFGITRRAFSEVPNTPRAQPARWSSAGSRSYSTQRIHSTFGGRVLSNPSSCPLPITRNGSSGASPAAARIVSSPCSGISFPTKTAVNGFSGVQPCLKSRSSAPTKVTARRSGESPPSPAKKSAFACVSATTRFAARKARRSRAASRRAAGDPAPKRPRSPTRVSTSETSGLNTTGRPWAPRRAATRST